MTDENRIDPCMFNSSSDEAKFLRGKAETIKAIKRVCYLSVTVLLLLKGIGTMSS